MILPIDTVFYNYDLFSQNTEKFRELFMTQEDDDFVVVSKDDDISMDCLLAIQTNKDENSCIVWKFETELKGEYSFDDLRKIVPNGQWLTFLTNFSSGTFMNTVPLKGLFDLHNPYLRTPWTCNEKYFHFDGKVSFLCGEIRHEKAYELVLKGTFFIRADKHIVCLNSGLYGIVEMKKEAYRLLKQKEFLESIKLT